MIENDVEKLLIHACKKVGIKSKKGNPQGDRGFVDRIVFHTKAHRILYVEIKNQTYYERTRKQKKWAKTITDSGGEYFLIDGAEEMKKFIKIYIYGSVEK